MDERQRKTDSDTGKPRWRSPMGGTQDDNQKHIGHDNLANERCHEGIAARRMGLIAVGGEPALNDIETRLAGRNEIYHECTGNCIRLSC